jgi:hypothetical protein
MAQPTDSFKQFHYGLRPSKQVERKIMIEVLHRLSKAGYDISDYIYLGFGSVYYVDFLMFHKYLFINSMVCVERSNVEKRMRFNKPYKFIKLKMGALFNYIPNIRRTKKHLVWLDYDRSLDQEMLQDIDGCLNRLAPQSIFVITIDARPKLPKDLFEFDIEDMAAEDREKLTVEKYQEWFGGYVEEEITLDTIARKQVAPLFYEAVVERIRQTLSRRSGGLRFSQIFNCIYQNGAPMFTIGGIIGTEEDKEALRKCGILEHKFVRTSSECLKISVPPLTIREKYWLDSKLDDKLTAAKLQFELEEELLDNYRKFYKEYPTYMESLL